MTDSTISAARVRASRWIGALLAVVIVAFDQVIKWVVTVPLSLQNRPYDPLEIVSFFDLRYAENRGVSLGMMQAETDAMRWGLVALTGAISIGVVYWMMRERARGDIVALGLILGGAIGNIIDRVRLGYVVDYADFHIGEIRPFMIFNLADAAITIGVLLLVARALLQGSGKSRTMGESNSPA